MPSRNESCEESFTLRVPRGTKSRLKALAALEGHRSASSLGREAIEEYLKTKVATQ